MSHSGHITTNGQKTNGKSKSHGLPLERCSGLVLIDTEQKGRGVFASKTIPADTIIETCPVLVLDHDENKKHIEHTSLYHYTYNWPIHDPATGKQITTQAVILGLGSMFNHSARNQNVGWERDLERQVVVYRTLRDVDKGEELCISYGARLTFIDADASPPPDEGDGSQLLHDIQLD